MGIHGEYVHRQISTFLVLFLNLFKLRIGILLGSRSRLHTRWDLRLCFSRLTLASSVDIACFSMNCSLINVRSSRDLSKGSQTYSFWKSSTSFSVGLARTTCAHFVCVLRVLSKGCACVMRTWLRLATEPKKKSESGISTRAFPLESPSR